MNKLAKLITSGKITVEELAAAPELIERANLVTEGLNACKKTIHFSLGVSEIRCYSYMDSAGEYEAWGSCSNTGIFTCSCNWGGNHVIGQINLMNTAEVFEAFEDQAFCQDLKRFLTQQIKKASEM